MSRKRNSKSSSSDYNLSVLYKNEEMPLPASSEVLNLTLENSPEYFSSTTHPVRSFNKTYGVPHEKEYIPERLVIEGVLPQPEFAPGYVIQTDPPVVPVLTQIPETIDVSAIQDPKNIIDKDVEQIEEGRVLEVPENIPEIPEKLMVQMIQDPNEDNDLFQMRKAITEFLFRDIQYSDETQEQADISQLATQSAITMAQLITKHIVYGLVYDDAIMTSIAEIMTRMNQMI